MIASFTRRVEVIKGESIQQKRTEERLMSSSKISEVSRESIFTNEIKKH